MYSYDRRAGSTDIKVHDVDFASGQEPDDAIEHQEDFVTLVRVTFTIGGATLARLLKKQDRVLEKALEGMKPNEVLNAAQKNQGLLRELSPPIKKMVQGYVRSKGAQATNLSVDFATEGDLPYSAKAEPSKKEIRFEMEFDVEGAIE